MKTRTFLAEPGPACYVCGAAPTSLSRPLPREAGPGDLVIAADGGLALCQRLGLSPHLFLGDGDSLRIPLPPGLPTHPLPVEKDDTDTLAALRLGLARGYALFHILGGVGGRLDHTLANVQSLLFLARSGAVGYLIGPGLAATVLTEGALRFPAGLTGTLSVFALGGEATGVTERGLHYSLQNATLTPDFPLGVSNRLLGRAAEVSVKTGALLILYLPDGPDGAMIRNG